MSVLEPLIRELPATDHLIFSKHALGAWTVLRKHEPDLFMTYRQHVKAHAGRHIAELLDEQLARYQPSVEQPLVALEIGDLLARDFTPAEAILSPWLRRQTLAMVHAARGMGKTHFALGVAYAVASGGTFLGWKAEKPWRVL